MFWLANVLNERSDISELKLLFYSGHGIPVPPISQFQRRQTLEARIFFVKILHFFLEIGLCISADI